MRIGFLVAFTVLVATQATSADPITRYEITDLGLASSSPDGDFPTLVINNRGTVAGQTRAFDSFDYRGFVFSRGQFDLFGTFDNFATDINDRGTLTAGYSVYQHDRRGVRFLGSLADDGFGMAINDRREIAAFQVAADLSRRAFLYTAAGPQDLGSLGGTFNLPYDVNNRSQVVGVSAIDGDTATRAFLASPGTPMIDLGTLGGRDSRAFGINDRGEIVGFSNLPGGEVGFFSGHAFLYTRSTGMISLGTLGGTRSLADAINNRGQIVGMSETPDGEIHAFLYSSGAMLDLNWFIDPLSEWILIRAVDINERGQIVCVGMPRDGFLAHTLLLNPVH